MSLRADSYGTVAEVQALCSYMLGGESAFNSTTNPTLTTVETFVNRASGALNVALAGLGITTLPITNSTAKLSCDSWVVERAAEYADYIHSGQRILRELQDGRIVGLRALQASANAEAEALYPGFVALGVSASGEYAGAGLKFTGEDATDQRDDLSDTSLRPPRFKKGMFDESSDRRQRDSDYY
jgi:hypothetical protein